MDLELTREEAQALQTLIVRHLSEMYVEISHAESSLHRSDLRSQRDALRRVQTRLIPLLQEAYASA